MSGSSPACRKMERAASSSSRQSCGLCSRRDERNTIDFRKPATSARWCSSGLSRKAGVVPRARNDSELHETRATGVRPGWMPWQHSARSAPLGRPHVRVGGRDGTCRDEAERTQDAERVPTPQHHQRIGSQRGRREAGCGESSQYRDSCPQRRAWRCSNCAVLLGNLVAGGVQPAVLAAVERGGVRPEPSSSVVEGARNLADFTQSRRTFSPWARQAISPHASPTSTADTRGSTGRVADSPAWENSRTAR